MTNSYNPTACKYKIIVVILTFTVNFANYSVSCFDAFFLFNIYINIVFKFGAILIFSI